VNHLSLSEHKRMQQWFLSLPLVPRGYTWHSKSFIFRTDPMRVLALPGDPRCIISYQLENVKFGFADAMGYASLIMNIVRKQRKQSTSEPCGASARSPLGPASCLSAGPLKLGKPGLTSRLVWAVNHSSTHFMRSRSNPNLILARR